MTGEFAEIAARIKQAKALLVQFRDAPPNGDREWLIFFRRLMDVIAYLDAAEDSARTGLEIAKENGFVSTTDPLDAIRELQAEFDEMLDV